MSVVLFILGSLWAAWARRAVSRGGLWAPAMVGAELGPWLAGAGLVLAAVFSFAGWAGGPFGWSGVLLLIVAAAAFSTAARRTLTARVAVAGAVAEITGIPVGPGPGALLGLVSPIARAPRSLVVDSGVRYGPHARHRMDHLRIAGPGLRPALVYVHGGGWWRGRHDTQARHMLYTLAAHGWHVFAPSYRLSPEATFPDHLVDVKRAIAWVRSAGPEHGVDPDFIAIAGGSSGGNLAALAGLTAGRPELQPGFEQIDTSVQACVPLYGVHDMRDRHGNPLWAYLETSVMKSPPDTEVWRQASPIHMATDRRPPFLVVHGTGDSLVGVGHSRRLVDALLTRGGPPAVLLEIPDANHGFDFFAGVRGRSVAWGVARTLQYLHERDRVQ